jgi:hypothetical protein
MQIAITAFEPGHNYHLRSKKVNERHHQTKVQAQTESLQGKNLWTPKTRTPKVGDVKINWRIVELSSTRKRLGVWRVERHLERTWLAVISEWVESECHYVDRRSASTLTWTSFWGEKSTPSAEWAIPSNPCQSEGGDPWASQNHPPLINCPSE